MNDELEIQQEEFKMRADHQRVLLDIKFVLSTMEGRNFISYLFKSFDVGELPPIGLNGDMLMDRLGFLRAGNSIFKIVSEAAPDTAGALLAEIEKERHAELQKNIFR